MAIDGKVSGLNTTTFNALQAIKKRNPGSLTEKDANELKAAVNKDGKIDDGERDLLEEMTQSQFRNITVTQEGNINAKVMTFPTVGNAKKVLQDTINPVLNLEEAWNNGNTGFNDIIKAYKKSPMEEARVTNFVADKLAKAWEQSNMGNGYKPLRDMIGRLYGFSNSAGSDTNTGRTILYKSMNQIDRNAGDSIPDFLYNWVRPGGYI